MSVHTRLYLLRMKHNLTKKAMAKVAGCALSTYKNYEYGLRTPPPAVILSIANYFNEDPGGIMFGEKEALRALSKEQAAEIISQLDEIAQKDKNLFKALTSKISDVYDDLAVSSPMKGK